MDEQMIALIARELEDSIWLQTGSAIDFDLAARRVAGVMAGKVAELIELLTLARKFVDNGGYFEDAGLKLLQERIDAALAPYPERRSE